jgi:magnesium chelatase subunit I
LDDLRRVVVPALRHRLRRDPLETTDAGERVLQAMEKTLGAEVRSRSS